MPVKDTILSLRRRLLALCERLGFVAPLLLRVTTAAIFVPTGYGKLTNLAGTTEFFHSLGIPLPGFNAALAAGTEFFGGLLVLVGLGTRLVSLPLAFTMAVAIATAKREELTGVVALLGFDEWVYLVMFVVLALIGPGALSIDALVARRFARPDAPAGLPMGKPAPAQP